MHVTSAIPVTPATGLASVPIVAPAIAGDRLGRLAAGVTLILAAAATLAITFIDDGSPRAVLLGGWVAAALAFGIGRSLGRRLRIDGLVRRSLSLPVIGVSVTAPLTMHAVLSFLLGASADDFRVWVAFSLVLTAQSHLVLALLAGTTVLRHLEGREAASTLQILLACVVSALVPVCALVLGDLDGLLPIAVITVVVQMLILGPVFMVPMMRWARQAAERERSIDWMGDGHIGAPVR